MSLSTVLRGIQLTLKLDADQDNKLRSPRRRPSLRCSPSTSLLSRRVSTLGKRDGRTLTRSLFPHEV